MMTWDEFVEDANQFIVLMNRCDPQNSWEWSFRRDLEQGEKSLKEKGIAFLQRKSRLKRILPSNLPISNGEDDENLPEMGGEQDAGEMKEEKEEEEEERRLIWFDLHILYSIGYQVPVLYFSASHSDGKMVPLESLWEILSGNSRDISSNPFLFHRLEASLVSQNEHPILGLPFYFLHPCNTFKVMHEIKSETDKNRLSSVPFNYLASWISRMGQSLGLFLPLSVFQQ